MSTLTAPHRTAAPTERRRGLRLGGLPWLVWRQHRAAFWTLIAVTVVGVAWMLYQRAATMDFLDGIGWPDPTSENWQQDFEPYADRMGETGYALGFIPVLVGVFLGAPLIADDLEKGTAKLVTSQSVSRTRWLATKLGLSTLVVVAGTVALSAAFGWWWSPMKKESVPLSWTSGGVFDTTGPVPVALTLFTMIGGVAIGLLLRRTLLTMVVTFGFAVAVQLVWDYFRLDLGTVVTVTTNAGVMGDTFPELPAGAHQVDQSYLTGSGELLGWSTCVSEPSEAAQAACLKGKDVVGWSVDYLPLSQMASMQWLGAGILLTLTAAITAFVLLKVRKRLI